MPLADPLKPLMDDSAVPPRGRAGRIVLLGGALLVVLLLAAAWKLTPLGTVANREALADFLLGTLLGMAPGLITIFALGATLSKLLREPSASNIVLVIVAAAVWLMLVVFSQYAIRRMTRVTAAG